MTSKSTRGAGIVSRRRKPKTPRIGRAPSYSDFRRLTPDENEREGFSRKARRYVLKSVRRLTKRTPTISARQHETLRTQQEYGFAKPEIATHARQHGALAYKTAAQREAVAKARVKREGKGYVSHFLQSTLGDAAAVRACSDALKTFARQLSFERVDRLGIVPSRKAAFPNATRCPSARPATHRCPSQMALNRLIVSAVALALNC